jgi:hypothetical protein
MSSCQMRRSQSVSHIICQKPHALRQSCVECSRLGPLWPSSHPYVDHLLDHGTGCDANVPRCPQQTASQETRARLPRYRGRESQGRCLSRINTSCHDVHVPSPVWPPQRLHFQRGPDTDGAEIPRLYLTRRGNLGKVWRRGRVWAAG